MVTPGHFKLHAAYLPDLKAGRYVLDGQQTLRSGSTTYATEPLNAHLKVTAPRFTLPADQILSTFPPANSEGAYESRLPQIVIKRRTLPWERKAAADSPNEEPWLALVVIAESEGRLSVETPVAECVTPGINLTGDNDVATSIYLSVPESVVRKVFPTRQDLSLLAHVREVDLRDTELALGDDDGFLSVVLANRLPQFDRVNCKPIRYLACLISLEGQPQVLPQPSTPGLTFDPQAAVLPAVAMAALAIEPDHAVSGATTAPEPRYATERAPQVKGGAKKSVANWATTTQAKVEEVALATSSAKVAGEVRSAMGIGFRRAIELVIPEKFYRFPVLAHWSFTCNGAGSFGSYVRELDVGMLGTEPPDPKGRKLPPCVEPAGGDAPPKPLPTRLPPELVETGHVGLPHVTRGGDALRSWYRGPLVPHVTTRDQPGKDGRLRLAHVSDQLRKLVPDGREDVALSAAFEIGRLLALSQPAVISALMRWRRQRFAVERAAQLCELIRPGIGGLLRELEWLRRPDLGALVSKELVQSAGARIEAVLAPVRPLVDPARPLDLLGQSLDDVLARGLAIPAEALRILRTDSAVNELGLGALSELRESDVALGLASDADFDAAALEHLNLGLTDVVERFATSSLTAPGGPSGFDPGKFTRGGTR